MLKNINVIINADSTNSTPIAVVKVEDTVLINLKVITAAGEFIDFTGQNIYISALRSDSSLVQQESFITIEKEAITIQLDKEFNALAGITQMELTAVDNLGMVTTANFYIRINSRIMSGANIKSAGYIETLENVKKEFVDSSNKIKENFVVTSNVAIDKVNTVAQNIKNESELVITEFRQVATKELEKLTADADKINKEALANNKITLDSFKENAINAITEFGVNSTQAIDNFNTTATVQLEKQKEDYGNLEKVIIDENVAVQFERRLANLESYHTPRDLKITSEQGFSILTENGLTLITE